MINIIDIVKNTIGETVEVVKNTVEEKVEIVMAPTFDIFIIGSTGTGKTILSKTLRGLPYDKEEDNGTPWEVYQSKTMRIEDKTIKLHAGVDFGGNDDFRVLYPQYIKRNTIVVLLFNVEKYMGNDHKEIADVNGRLLGVKDVRSSFDNVFIIGTHYDKVENLYTKKEIENKLMSYLFKEKGNIMELLSSDQIEIMSFGYDDPKDPKKFIINKENLDLLICKLLNIKTQ